MSYEKRVCVLKQIKKGFSADGGALSGAVYAERLGTELTVTPKILGIAPVKDGRYALAVYAEGETAVLELKGNAPLKLGDFPSIKAGFAALLVFLRGEPEPVAYGSCGVAPREHTALLAAFTRAEKRKKEVPPPPPPPEFPLPFAPNAPVVTPPGKEEEARPFREQASAKYDDEAIAAENYFGGAFDGDAAALHAGPRDETAQADGASADADDGDVLFRPRGTLTYYRTVCEKLQDAFRRFPKDDRLKAVFPQSEWVQAESALLGVIYKEGIPQFLCVAVPAQGDPPAEMKEHGCFVPASPYSEEEGFWVVFQSADSGEYVTISDS